MRYFVQKLGIGNDSDFENDLQIVHLLLMKTLPLERLLVHK